MEVKNIIHQFQPVYTPQSKILMLGTMPSPKSREQGFYYGHPRNRFWRVVSDIRGEKEPQSIEEKKAFLIRNNIAIWDVLYSCDIAGADDNSIKNPIPNDISRILNKSDIRAVFATGKKAESLYKRYCLKDTGMDITGLPSTSPANCRITYEQLYQAYSIINKYL